MGARPSEWAKRDRRIARTLERWFADAARDLPWRRVGRGGRRDPYRSLVSEAMLQQTQVARVLERFDPFVRRFPTVRALAAADLDDVLAAWSGLGYYRRARLLHEAALAIVAEHGGRVPRDVGALRALPGVGRYTAGAIASMVFGQPQPIVDGNVRRVIVRLEGREGDDAWAWERAGALVEAAEEPGVFNEGLMELGATLCTPRAPRCAECPLRRECIARREGRADSIPAPKAAAGRRVLHQASVVVRDRRGRTLVEQRGDRGLWARMWQAPTLEGSDAEARASEVAEAVGLVETVLRERFTHQTTHRRVEIAVWEGWLGRGRRPRRGRWASRAEIEGLALSNPQRRILLGPG